MFIDPGLARILVILQFAAAAAILPLLLFLPAPYGRFSRPGWGPAVKAGQGWFLMELPSALIPALLFLAGGAWRSPYALACLLIWEAHYVQRDLAYPFMIRSTRPMPLAVAGMGFGFNVLNSYLNAWWLFRPEALSGPSAWNAVAAGTAARLLSPAFIAGAALFILGFAVNLHSDRVLREIRAGGARGYAVPDRGLHKLVASPNYLGELMEWIGWASLASNPAGWAFAAFTLANLAPRALKNLAWYRSTFGDSYPRERKAIIPFIL
jgi:3-oxo-5-alpha-steroid 4-dehydrogenase 1